MEPRRLAAVRRTSYTRVQGRPIPLAPPSTVGLPRMVPQSWMEAGAEVTGMGRGLALGSWHFEFLGRDAEQGACLRDEQRYAPRRGGASPGRTARW